MSRHAQARPSLAARAAEGARSTRGALILFGLLALLFIATAAYGRVSTDIRATFIPAWELGQHHTINSDGFLKVSQFFHEVDGHVRSDRFPGAILAGVPAYALYALFGGSSHPVIGPASVTAALMAAGSVLFMHRALLRITTPGVALAGALTFALGTSTWTVSADALWGHTATQLGICATLYGLAANRALWPFLGMALAASARPHVAVVAGVLGLGLLLRRDRDPYDRWPLTAALAAGTAVGWCVILAWTRLTFGSATLLPGSYQGRGSDLSKIDPSKPGGKSDVTAVHGWPENIFGFLFSPERGVLILTPILALCLIGLFRAWRGAPGWTKDAAAAGIAYSIVQLGGNYFAGGASFYSYRLAIEGVTLVTALAVLGAVAMLDRAWWRRIAFVLIAYGFAVHAIGALFFQAVLQPFRPLSWSFYWPYRLTEAAPWRAPVAVLIGLVLALAVTALVRSDPGRQDAREPDVAERPEPGTGPDEPGPWDESGGPGNDSDDDGPDDDGPGTPPGPAEPVTVAPGGVGTYVRGRRISGARPRSAGG